MVVHEAGTQPCTHAAATVGAMTSKRKPLRQGRIKENGTVYAEKFEPAW